MLKIKKATEKGNINGPRIYAENTIHKCTKQMNYLCLTSTSLSRISTCKPRWPPSTSPWDQKPSYRAQPNHYLPEKEREISLTTPRPPRLDPTPQNVRRFLLLILGPFLNFTEVLYFVGGLAKSLRCLILNISRKIECGCGCGEEDRGLRWRW